MNLSRLATTAVTLLATALLGLAPCAARPAPATSTTPLKLDGVNTIITQLSHGQMQAKRLFSGPDGLIGAVVEDTHGHDSLVWLTPHGKALIHGGELVAPDGTDLARQAMLDQGLLMGSDALLTQAAAAGAHGIVVGSSGPILTAMIDANCIYCHLLYEKLKPSVKAGKLRVRYVMVGVVKKSSVARAAAILAAPSPADALAKDEDAFKRKVEEGGYPAAKATPASTAIVQANNHLFDKAGAQGTPALLYCSKSSGKVERVDGLPATLADMLSDLAVKPHAACG